MLLAASSIIPTPVAASRVQPPPSTSTATFSTAAAPPTIRPLGSVIIKAAMTCREAKVAIVEQLMAGMHSAPTSTASSAASGADGDAGGDGPPRVVPVDALIAALQPSHMRLRDLQPSGVNRLGRMYVDGEPFLAPPPPPHSSSSSSAAGTAATAGAPTAGTAPPAGTIAGTSSTTSNSGVSIIRDIVIQLTAQPETCLAGDMLVRPVQWLPLRGAFAHGPECLVNSGDTMETIAAKCAAACAPLVTAPSLVSGHASSSNNSAGEPVLSQGSPVGYLLSKPFSWQVTDARTKPWLFKWWSSSVTRQTAPSAAAAPAADTGPPSALEPTGTTAAASPSPSSSSSNAAPLPFRPQAGDIICFVSLADYENPAAIGRPPASTSGSGLGRPAASSSSAGGYGQESAFRICTAAQIAARDASRAAAAAAAPAGGAS